MGGLGLVAMAIAVGAVAQGAQDAVALVVYAAIRLVGPDLVDVSSGVEGAPGIKDPARLIRFLQIARDAHPAA